MEFAAGERWSFGAIGMALVHRKTCEDRTGLRSILGLIFEEPMRMALFSGGCGGQVGVIPLGSRNIVTMSVKPSDFWGQSRNKSRNIFVGSRNKLISSQRSFGSGVFHRKQRRTGNRDRTTGRARTHRRGCSAFLNAYFECFCDL